MSICRTAYTVGSPTLRRTPIFRFEDSASQTACATGECACLAGYEPAVAPAGGVSQSNNDCQTCSDGYRPHNAQCVALIEAGATCDESEPEACSTGFCVASSSYAFKCCNVDTCSGRGYCGSTGNCACDAGYTGATCDTPLLAVSTPNSTTVWTKKQMNEIKWSVLPAAGPTVRIYMYQDDRIIKTISSATSNDGSYEFDPSTVSGLYAGEGFTV